MAEDQSQKSERVSFPSLDRGQMVMLGIVFMVLGLLQFAGAAYFVSKAGDIRKEAGEQEKASHSTCVSSLKGMNFLVEDVEDSKGKVLRASKPKIDDPALRLGEASVATLACPGWQLTNFCMGDGCEKSPGGIWLEITASK